MNVVNFYPLHQVPKYLDALIWGKNTFIKNYNKGTVCVKTAWESEENRNACVQLFAVTIKENFLLTYTRNLVG